jgi:hypothetical protein
MRKIFKLAAGYLHPAAIFSMPPGLVAEKAGAGGLYGLMANLNNYCESSYTTTTGQAVSNVVTVTAAQITIGQLVIPTLAGITGGFVIQLPSTVALLAQLGPTIPTDGSYAEPLHISNSSGQTGTMTVGDASTTISGTATVASGATRKYLLTVNAGGTTLTLINMGSWTYP